MPVLVPALLPAEVVPYEALLKHKETMRLNVEQTGPNLMTLSWESLPNVYYYAEGTNQLSHPTDWTTAKLLTDLDPADGLMLSTQMSGDKAFYRLDLHTTASPRIYQDSNHDQIIDKATADAGLDAFAVPDPTDSDNDGVPDYFEQFHFGTLEHDGSYIAVSGGLTLAQSFASATNPKVLDSDGDGLKDADDPKPNYDQSREDPNGDPDEDGLTSAEEHAIGSKPFAKYSDSDSLHDGEDAMPLDGDLAWKRSPESNYVLIDLGHPAEGSFAGIFVSSAGYVVTDSHAWNPGTWTWQSIPEPSLAVVGVDRNGLVYGDWSDAGWIGYKWAVGSNTVTAITDYAVCPETPDWVDPNDGIVFGMVSDSGYVFGHTRDVSAFLPTRWSGAGADIYAVTGCSTLSGKPKFYGATERGTALWVNGNDLMLDTEVIAPDLSVSELANLSFSGMSIASAKLPLMPHELIGIGKGLKLKVGRSWTDKLLYEDLKRKTLLAGTIRELADDGTILTSDHKLWRNGVATPLNELVSNKDAYSPLTARDMAPNGLIAATATKIKNADGSEIPRADRKEHVLMLLPVEVEVPKVSSSGSEISGEFVSAQELKVGKMEGAVDANGIRIDDDVDRFRVRIPGVSGASTMSVKIETLDNPDYELVFNDEPDEITLSPAADGNGFTSDWMLLVSGNIDDAEARVNVGADNDDEDKTHQIQVGGKVKLSELKINGNAYAIDVRKEVKIKKELDVVLINLVDEGGMLPDSPTLSQSDIEWVKRHLIRRFAQVGVKVNMDVIPVTESEADITLSALLGNGLAGKPDEIGNHIKVSSEMQSLMNRLKTLGHYRDDAVCVVFAPKFDTTGHHAFAVTDSVYDPTNVPGPFIMLDWLRTSSDRYVIAHELLHVLLDASHDYSGGSGPVAQIAKYQSDFNDKRTIWGGTNNQPKVEASRRIYRSMARDLLQSRFLKNPQTNAAE